MVEPSPTTLGQRLPHAICNTLVRPLLGRLELGLDRVRREGDTPHGDTGGGTGGDDRRDGKFVRAGGLEGVLDEFVGDKVAAGAASVYLFSP
jgi:hypothetical protein